MLAAITVEWLKLRRSRISLITTVLVGIGVPALTAGFLAAATRGPADTPLAIKVNALLIGEGWPAYLGMLAQILSVMSFLGVGFVVAWCFGREFTDHTITGLYALPTSRITIAAAKYIVLLAWSLALSLITWPPRSPSHRWPVYRHRQPTCSSRPPKCWSSASTAPCWPTRSRSSPAPPAATYPPSPG